MSDVFFAEASWTKDRIDKDYNARSTVASETFQAIIKQYRQQSDVIRDTFITHSDIVYDQQSGEKLDIYGTSLELRPVFVFIHGGYWRALSKLDSSFMAKELDKNGIATVVIDYSLSPKVTLSEIVRQVRAAIAFIWHHGKAFGLDANNITLSGSSAGGHLVGTILSGGWHETFHVPHNIIKAAMPVSGLFHLAPIACSFAQEWLSLSEEEVKNYSPLDHLPTIGCPMIIAYAETEADGFKRQSIAYHKAWQFAGFSSQCIEVADCNHFDIILDFAVAGSQMNQELLKMIKKTA